LVQKIENSSLNKFQNGELIGKSLGKAWKTTGEDMSNILIVDLERKKLFSS